VKESKGRIRADKAHDKLVAMGFTGSERTTRRAVLAAKRAWRAGNGRSYKPWVPEPGRWLQYDWGTGPVIDGRQTQLWCAWLAWSRFRVVIPVWDKTLGTVLTCLDATWRRLGGAPTYVLTDNERTVTIDRIAGVAIRHPELVRAGRHYGVSVLTCEPADPESKGGSEATVKIAKADLVPTEVNLLAEYGSFAELEAACAAWGERVNARVHRETARRPVEMLAVEQAHLHVVPAAPYAAALGETRTVDGDQTVRFGSVRYSTPPGHRGTRTDPVRAGDPRVDRPSRESGGVRPLGHRQVPLGRGARPRRDRRRPARVVVHPRVAHRHDRPRQGRRVDHQDRRAHHPRGPRRRRRHRDAARAAATDSPRRPPARG
jgi:transposase